MSDIPLTGVLTAEFSSDFSALANQLAEHGYAVVPSFLQQGVGESLVDEIARLWDDGEYRRAAVGRGHERKVRSEIRSDHVHWLDPIDLTPPQRGYWEQMERMREALNRDLFLGLFDFEAHLACFQPGAHYQAHLDQHRETRARVVSAVVYLNERWAPEDGGHLRLYIDRNLGTAGPWIDIIPEFGKLVIFLSADFWHEVLPARRERHSLTGWFRRRIDEVPLT
ncbi:MAG: 2OG-Fe(II) oxygenase [Verrucomicrobiae bacterium]|nr:2OG-Fe(II) oxygenase [Verrucomicrobiae bacterium]